MIRQWCQRPTCKKRFRARKTFEYCRSCHRDAHPHKEGRPITSRQRRQNRVNTKRRKSVQAPSSKKSKATPLEKGRF